MAQIKTNFKRTRTTLVKNKTASKKTKKLPFSKRNKRFLPFIIVFALIGGYFVFNAFAATNTVKYTGSLTNSQPSQAYQVTIGVSGEITASHNSKDSNMRVSILNSNNDVIAQKSGSGASTTVPVDPGTYSIRMDYLSAIKGAKKYTVTITYPVEDIPPPPADTTPPTVLLSSPSSDTVKGTTEIAVTAIDDTGVTKVEFMIDGTLIGTDTSSPYGYPWNTLTVQDGLHSIQAKAYDAAGNSGTAGKSVTVSNATTPTSYPAALWHADADKDTDKGSSTLFMGKNTDLLPTSRLSIVDDPRGQYGKVYKSELTSTDISTGNKRAEWKESYLGDGTTKLNLWGTNAPTTTTLYIGWRSLFGNGVALTNSSNDGNYLQWKGDSTCGGPAVGGTIASNRYTIRTIDGAYLAYTGPLMTSLIDNRWHDMVMLVNFSKTNTGYVEFWLDGVKQTMANGQQRVYLPTVCPNDTKVWTKWGVYGMDSGAPTQWVESPRIGTTYESVVPR